MPQPAKYLNPVLAAALCLVALMVKVQAQAGQPQAPPDAPAAQLTFTGSEVFKDYCAVCHGTSARGDGPLADRMKRRPPDLTVLATQNGGVFPAEQVRKTIDGRESVPGHGGPDMPVWGSAFKDVEARLVRGIGEIGDRRTRETHRVAATEARTMNGHERLLRARRGPLFFATRCSVRAIVGATGGYPVGVIP